MEFLAHFQQTPASDRGRAASRAGQAPGTGRVLLLLHFLAMQLEMSPDLKMWFTSRFHLIFKTKEVKDVYALYIVF